MVYHKFTFFFIFTWKWQRWIFLELQAEGGNTKENFSVNCLSSNREITWHRKLCKFSRKFMKSLMQFLTLILWEFSMPGSTKKNWDIHPFNKVRDALQSDALIYWKVLQIPFFTSDITHKHLNPCLAATWEKLLMDFALLNIQGCSMCNSHLARWTEKSQGIVCKQIFFIKTPLFLVLNSVPEGTNAKSSWIFLKSFSSKELKL